MWRQATELAVTRVEVGSAEVLGFSVCDVAETPGIIREMQVSGLELHDPCGPGEPVEDRPVIFLNPHLTMTTAKAMAQAGHGAMLAWERAVEPARSEWLRRGLPLSVRTASTQVWLSVAEHAPS